MKPVRLLPVAARALWALVNAFTALYCVCAYIPFTYQQVIKGGLLPGLEGLVRFHPYIYGVALFLTACSLYREIRQPKTRLHAAIFLVVMCMGATVLAFRPLLPRLENDRSSLWWAFLSLAPLLWLGIIDWSAHYRSIVWGNTQENDMGRLFWTSVSSALFVSFVYSSVTSFRVLSASGSGLNRPEFFYLLLLSACTTLFLFMILFLALCLVAGVAGLAMRPARLGFIIYSLTGVLLVAAGFNKIALRAVSFTGPAAAAFAFFFALAMVVSFLGCAMKLYQAEDGPVADPLSFILNPLRSRGIMTASGRLGALALLTAAGIFLALKSAVLDWNYLVQELAAAGICLVAFATFYAMSSGLQARRDRTSIYMVATLLVLATQFGLARTSARVWNHLSPASFIQTNSGQAIERYTGYDVSFKLARSMISLPAHAGSYYQFLARNTNIPRSVSVKPVNVELIDGPISAGTDPSGRFNIFIIVIDSLRRDYLSVYNSEVGFTPAIDSFARESVVMNNAFTRYGGTGLSEPSIWAGGMLLHKQYVTPFAPMNTLQKLLKAENYRSFISRDSILSTVVERSPSLIELDQANPTMTYDLSRTLKELEGKLKQPADARRPIFVYTQPQNIHTSVINREEPKVPEKESYPGFYAPYASRLRQMDASFGEFIEFLKRQGLYDNSIVILTSDHGDSLGEDGRWGHAYTIFPEVVRIPLIIHLPPVLRSHLVADRDSVAFLTDITPSLYYILGHKPVRSNEITGRPLFTESSSEQDAYRRDSYLIASSYGPVYGILSNHGKRLYIADGVNYRDYLYDLSQKPLGTSIAVPSSERAAYEALIHSRILGIDSFYEFNTTEKLP